MKTSVLLVVFILSINYSIGQQSNKESRKWLRQYNKEQKYQPLLIVSGAPLKSVEGKELLTIHSDTKYEVLGKRTDTLVQVKVNDVIGYVDNVWFKTYPEPTYNPERQYYIQNAYDRVRFNTRHLMSHGHLHY